MRVLQFNISGLDKYIQLLICATYLSGQIYLGLKNRLYLSQINVNELKYVDICEESV